MPSVTHTATPPSAETLAAILRRLPDLADLDAAGLEPLPVRGVAHDHWRLRGRGLVARLPRLSQLGLDPAANLAYQATAFRRAQPSGATPRLHAELPPDEALPGGLLLVEEIAGRPPRLPEDLPAIARALAALHRLPVPAAADRPPIGVQTDPFTDTLALVDRNLAYADRLDIAPAALDALRAERAALGALALPATPQPTRLVLSDAHPGNYLVADDGRAVAVDLERMLYGAPAIDLAHVTLYTSTGWDAAVATRLEAPDVARFLDAWRSAAGPELVAGVEPWLAPMRRLTWLRTTAFLMKWLVESAGRGDWSNERLGAPLAGHFRAHALDCLSVGTIARIRAELSTG